MMGEHIVILALLALCLLQFAALCIVLVKVAPMLPPSVVTELMTHVGNAVMDAVLNGAEPVVKLTPTQFDDLALKIARDLRAELGNKKGVVETPLEEQ